METSSSVSGARSYPAKYALMSSASVRFPKYLLDRCLMEANFGPQIRDILRIMHH